ncbi:MAG: GNAT family N-acetyltransferase [Chthonomonadaceae bacterium]|nr:GNAT family N-acetyltransferase [Chthonomonadaceae bacterium]
MTDPNNAPLSYTVRRATSDDAEIIIEYNARLAFETENMILDRAVLLPGVRTALSDEKIARYYVAVNETGDVIGQTMVTYEWSDWRNGTLWWFQSVYVREDARGKGIFRALFERVVEEGKREGAVGFRLYAVAENEVALSTYKRLGMERTHYIVLEI